MHSRSQWSSRRPKRACSDSSEDATRPAVAHLSYRREDQPEALPAEAAGWRAAAEVRLGPTLLWTRGGDADGEGPAGPVVPVTTQDRNFCSLERVSRDNRFLHTDDVLVSVSWLMFASQHGQSRRTCRQLNSWRIERRGKSDVAFLLLDIP